MVFLILTRSFNICRNDLSLCISNVPKLCSVYSAAFLSEKPNVISSVTSCMQTVLNECMAPAATESNIEQYKSEIRKIYELLKSCMKYTYHMAWKSVLYLLATMYKVRCKHSYRIICVAIFRTLVFHSFFHLQTCGRTCSDFMIDYLRELADLRDSDEYAYEKEIDNIFSGAIQSIGPEKIILQIPLQVNIIIFKKQCVDFTRQYFKSLIQFRQSLMKSLF